MDLESLSSGVYFFHALVSKISKTPEWEFEKQEANAFAEALLQVSRHYPNVQMAQKTMDWMNLMGCMALLYGPRMNAIKKRKQEERQQRQQPRQAPAA